MNRGRNKDNIFHDKSDFQLFLNILGSAIDKVPLVKVKSNLVPFFQLILMLANFINIDVTASPKPSKKTTKNLFK